jgi:hypothetical protein
MKKVIFLAFLAGLAVLAFDPEIVTGRGRGGGGGGRGGGVGAGRPAGGGAVNPYGGGTAVGSRSTTPIVGAGGGSGTAGRTSGSVTTQRGTTIDYRGAGVGGTTAGGVTGGKTVGGVQVTTPGGREATKVGSAGAAVGPGGNAVAGRSGAGVASGPKGAVAGKYQGGVAIGPQGAAAGGSRAGVASGPGGTVVAGSRGAVASGPYGAAAGRSTVVAGRGTYYRSTTAIRTQGVYVRHGVAAYPCFRAGWYAQYPGAWLAAGWAAGGVWRAATWGTCSSYCGYPSEPVYYDYGESVAYQDDGVYVAGQNVGTPEQYADQATQIADTGRDAKAAKDDDWMPLGVFAMVQGDEKTSNHIFQLAINKQGVLRGNYYDAVTDSTSQVFGSVDKKTQRAAWTVGDRKAPVYEVGIANLTRNETTMLVHYSKDRTQQFSLVRIEENDVKDGEMKDGK